MLIPYLLVETPQKVTLIIINVTPRTTLPVTYQKGDIIISFVGLVEYMQIIDYFTFC